MAKRYTGGVGKRFTGDFRRAESLMPLARKLAQLVLNTLNSPVYSGIGLIKRVFRLTDGDIIHVSVNTLPEVPIIRTHIHSPFREDEEGEEKKYTITTGFLTASWEPEGILLTPRSDNAPYGYGFPKRDQFTGEKIDPPFGTQIELEEDEALNQVLINKFKNNKYLDDWDHIEGIDKGESNVKKIVNPMLRESLEKTVNPDRPLCPYQSWSLHWEPPDEDGSKEWWNQLDEDTQTFKNRFEWVDQPGIDLWPGYGKSGEPASYYKPKSGYEDKENGTLKNRQFKLAFPDNDISKIYESESASWFCHWPEEILYENDAFEKVFQISNEYRDEVGRGPVHRPVRGFCNLARTITVECANIGKMYHENEEFRPGYRTLLGRSTSTGSAPWGLGENVAVLPTADVTEGSAETAMTAWRNSPGHYANIINEAWDEVENSTELSVFGGTRGTFDDSLNGPIDPPITGASWSQVFCLRKNWLSTGELPITTNFGTVSSNGFLFSACQPTNYFETSYIFYSGRRYINWLVVNRQNNYELAFNLGTCAFLREDGVKCLRNLVIYWRQGDVETEPDGVISEVTSYILPLGGEQEEAWYIEASDTTVISTGWWVTKAASFSPDGSEALFCINVPGDRVAETHFGTGTESYPRNEADRISLKQRCIKFSNAEFSLYREWYAPDMVYSYVEEEEFTIICHETADLYPFYDREGEVQWMKYEINFDWIGTLDEPDFENINNRVEITVDDYLIFPSGKRLSVQRMSSTFEGSGPWDSPIELPDFGPAYMAAFLYIDEVDEDVVYVKIHRTEATLNPDRPDEGTTALNETYTGEFWVNDEIVGYLPPVTSPTLYVPSFIRELGLPQVSNLPNMFWAFGRTMDYPSWDGYVYFSLHNGLGPIVFAGLNPIIDSHPCSFGTGTLFLAGQDPWMNVTHEVPHKALYCHWNGNSIGVVDISYQVALLTPYNGLEVGENVGAYARVAKYKGRMVVNIICYNLHYWTEDMLSDSQKSIIWANFDLEEEVGIGPLTKITPLGVI